MNPSGRAHGIVCGKTFSRRTPNGKLVFKFSLACYDPYRRKNNFFNCVAFGKTAEIIERNYTDKDTVIIDYDWTVEEWEDKEGNKRRKDVMMVKSVDLVEWRIRKKMSGYDAAETPGNPTRDPDPQESQAGTQDDDPLPF